MRNKYTKMKIKISRFRNLSFIILLFTLSSPCIFSDLSAGVMKPAATKKYFAEKKLDFTDTMIFSGGRNMRFVCTGNDTMPVMFFIHGSPGAWSDYRDYLTDPTLLKSYHMISADRPGYNGSAGEGVATLEEQSNCLQGLFSLRKTNKPIIVVGHSYGGAVSVKFVLQNKEKVARLILISPCLAPDVEQNIHWKRTLQKLSQTTVGRKVTPLFLKNSTKEMQPLPQEVRKMEKDFVSLTVPILEIHGTWDMMAPYGNLAYIEKAFPNSSVHTITFKNKNHKIVYSMPKVMIGLMMKELETKEEPQQFTVNNE
jgi:pimeloyl-ACP methyl ester carboxylesterase